MIWNQESLIPQPQIYHVWSLLLPAVQSKIYWLWDKANCYSYHRAKSEAGLNLIPWLLSIWRYLVAGFPVSSFSCLSCAAAIQVFWLSIHLKCRFDRYLGFNTHLSTPSPFLLFAYVRFFISIFCFKSFSLLFYCLAQHSSIDKLYIYLWPGGIPFHTALITSHYNQLPKEGSNSLNLRTS